MMMLMLGMSTTLVNAQTDTTKVVKKTHVHTKKNGTPDRRYKENKTSSTTTVVGPTKKDGTADMRYKANKTVVKKSATKPKQ